MSKEPIGHSLLSYAIVPTDSAPPLAAGVLIDGRFEVVSLLGRGAVGEVYRARDRRRGKDVALKLLSKALAANDGAKAGFRREVEIALDITHPNVVRVHDVGEWEGRPYLHMELIDGGALRAAMKGTPYGVQKALDVAKGFLTGLAHAHARGLVHLDVKPENILLGKDGDVKVSDLGLSRWLEAQGMGGFAGGTPYYVAPEQRRGGPVDARADVYAAGVVLYELLSGELPVGRWEPLPFSIPSPVREAVDAALSRDPALRPADAAVLLERLLAPAPPQAPPAEPRASAPQGTPRGLTLLGKNPQGLDVYENSIGMRLVLIPAGEFLMGEEPNEAPVHRVVLTRSYLLGEAPVAQAEYDRIMPGNPSRFKGADLPVDRVKWPWAVDFCRRLGEKEDAAYRLPTEAEWEHACRAGTRTSFYWGDDAARATEYAWFRDNAGDGTRPVRRLLPNAWGLFDMAGNMFEWCADVYDLRVYQRRGFRTTDPANLLGVGPHVLRGGCFESFARQLRSAQRWRYRDQYRVHLRGFRIARTFV